MKYTLGVDLGGTTAKVALVSSDKKILKQASIISSGFPNSAQLVEKISDACKSLLDKRKAQKVGVGVAGDIDSQRGVVRVSPNLGWKNVPLGPLIRKKMKCDVVVENDANAAAWGLYKTQIPKSVRNLIVMTLGTGVGGGIIVNGVLLRGATGSAGEVGHMNIEEKGPLCNCGNRGCLETYVGGPHIVNKVRAALQKGHVSSLRSLNPSEITPETISKAALKGDAYALSVWEDVGRALGIAIGDLVYLLNPEWIVFTGGVAQAGELILKPLRGTLNKRAFRTPVEAVKIKVASNAAHIGVIGASLL